MNAKPLVELLRAALEDKKAEDILVIDLQGRSAIADHFLIATGSSGRHLQAMADEVDRVSHLNGSPVLGIEGVQEATWILVDTGDVIVHLFLNEVRKLYDLEKLWSPQALLALDAGRKPL